VSRDARVARQETYGLGDDFELGHDCYRLIDVLIGTGVLRGDVTPSKDLVNNIHPTRGYIPDPSSTWNDPLGVVGASAEAFSETKTELSRRTCRSERERSAK